ncbi:hypothetical protein AgCh_034659 [Apium graveolens]
MKAFKGYVRNPAHPEGCIAEAYVAEEAVECLVNFEEAIIGLLQNSMDEIDAMCRPLSGASMLKPNSITIVDKFSVANSGDLKQKWRPAPTRCGQDKWDRAYKAVTGGSEFMLREIKKPVGDPEVLAAESREQYLKLKNKMQLLTLGIEVSLGILARFNIDYLSNSRYSIIDTMNKDRGLDSVPLMFWFFILVGDRRRVDLIKEKMENGNDACGHSQKKEPLDGKAS